MRLEYRFYWQKKNEIKVWKCLYIAGNSLIDLSFRPCYNTLVLEMILDIGQTWLVKWIAPI